MKLPKFFRKNVSLKTVNVIGKKWFDRVNGNTYNSAVVTVNQGFKNEFSFSLPITYGYGDYYLQRTIEFLASIGAVESYNTFHRMQLDNKIRVTAYCIDNCKKSDVKAWGESV